MSERQWARFGATRTDGSRIIAEVITAETPGVNDLSDYAEITGADPMPTVGWSYDGQGNYTPEVAARTISAGEFMDRLTTSEREAWLSKQRTDLSLQVHRETITLASPVNLDAISVIGVVNALVGAGVLTDARAAEILS